MVAVIDDKDGSGETKIDGEMVCSAVGRLFLGMGEDGLGMLGGYLEDLQVIPLAGHLVDTVPEDRTKYGGQVTGNASGDVARVVEHMNTSLIWVGNIKSASAVNGRCAYEAFFILLHGYNIWVKDASVRIFIVQKYKLLWQLFIMGIAYFV